jgi:hypothetical protein
MTSSLLLGQWMTTFTLQVGQLLCQKLNMVLLVAITSPSQHQDWIRQLLISVISQHPMVKVSLHQSQFHSQQQVSLV